MCKWERLHSFFGARGFQAKIKADEESFYEEIREVYFSMCRTKLSTYQMGLQQLLSRTRTDPCILKKLVTKAMFSVADNQRAVVCAQRAGHLLRDMLKDMKEYPSCHGFIQACSRYGARGNDGRTIFEHLILDCEEAAITYAERLSTILWDGLHYLREALFSAAPSYVWRTGPELLADIEEFGVHNLSDDDCDIIRRLICLKKMRMGEELGRSLSVSEADDNIFLYPPPYLSSSMFFVIHADRYDDVSHMLMPPSLPRMPHVSANRPSPFQSPFSFIPSSYAPSPRLPSEVSPPLTPSSKPRRPILPSAEGHSYRTREPQRIMKGSAQQLKMEGSTGMDEGGNDIVLPKVEGVLPPQSRSRVGESSSEEKQSSIGQSSENENDKSVKKKRKGNENNTEAKSKGRKKREKKEDKDGAKEEEGKENKDEEKKIEENENTEVKKEEKRDTSLQGSQCGPKVVRVLSRPPTPPLTMDESDNSDGTSPIPF